MFVKKNLDLRRVVVTGMGLINSMGFDVPTVWERLLAGQSGVRQVNNLSSYMNSYLELHPLPDDFPRIAGQIVDFDLKEFLQTRKKNPTKESKAHIIVLKPIVSRIPPKYIGFREKLYGPVIISSL